MIKNFILLLSILLLLTGCIGQVSTSDTVEATSGPTGPVEIAESKIPFRGIESAQAISDSSILVKFKPATDDSAKYVYHVYLNGSEQSVLSVPSQFAQRDDEGNIFLHVKNLNFSSFYIVAVKAYDIQKQRYDNNSKILNATTFSDAYPLFDGIASIENLVGISGTRKLKVNWKKALPSAQLPPNSSSSEMPYGYFLYYAKSISGLLDKLHQNTFDISINNINQTDYILGDLSSLEENTNYYIAVRAKNSSIPAGFEKNEKFLSKKTTVLLPLSFAGIQTARIPPTLDGFNTINVTWNNCQGCDEYRVYALDTNRPIDINTDTLFLKATLSAGATSVQISGSPHTQYYIGVVACRESGFCSGIDQQGADTLIGVKTTPPVAPFNGITTITQPAGEIGLTSLNINWDGADILSGQFNEYRIFLVDSNGNELDNNAGASGVQSRITNFNITNPNGIYIDSTTPLTENTTHLWVKNIPTNTEVCFKVLPYSTTPPDPILGERTLPSAVTKCATASYSPANFLGVNTTCSNPQLTALSINWNTPTQGIFSHYEIFFKRKDGNAFDYNAALLDTASVLPVGKVYRGSVYTLIKEPVADVTLPYTISIFPDFASEYEIGVQTYYQLPNGTISRINNSRIAYGATCTTAKPTMHHKEWLSLLSLGPKRNALTNTLIAESFNPTTFAIEENISGSDSGIISFNWNDFELAEIAGTKLSHFASSYLNYEIQRATSPSGPWTTVEIIPTVSGQTTYRFTHLNQITKAPGTTYYYQVIASINGDPMAFANTPINNTLKILKVILPTQNMAYIPRWLLNKDTCHEMQRTSDPLTHYQCAYDGISSQNGFMNFPYDIIMDRFESGCKWSLASCDGTNDCIGTGTPSATVTANNGAIYYDRIAAKCYVNTSATSGTTWLDVGNVGLNTTLRNNAVSSQAKLPPANFVTQTTAQAICQSKSIQIDSTNYSKRLLRRAEFMLASKWPEQRSSIGTLESGTLDQHSACNSNSRGFGLTTWSLNDNRYPGGNTSDSYAVITGSSGNYSTSQCLSKYGIQDLIGNVWEWNTDQVQNISVASVFQYGTSDPAQITGIVLDPTNQNLFLKNGDGTYVQFSPTDIAPSTTTTMTSANYLNLTLGMPLNCNGGTCASQTDDNTIFSAKSIGADINNYPTNGDKFTYNIFGKIGGYSGGSWQNTTESGRFNYSLTTFTTGSKQVGFRCIVEIP